MISEKEGKLPLVGGGVVGRAPNTRRKEGRMDEQKERREGGLRRTLLPGNATPSPPWLTHSIHSSQALILQNRPGCSLKPKGDSQVRAREQRN